MPLTELRVGCTHLHEECNRMEGIACAGRVLLEVAWWKECDMERTNRASQICWFLSVSLASRAVGGLLGA